MILPVGAGIHTAVHGNLIRIIPSSQAISGLDACNGDFIPKMEYISLLREKRELTQEVGRIISEINNILNEVYRDRRKELQYVIYKSYDEV